MRMDKPVGREAEAPRLRDQAVLEVDGKFIALDAEGYLVDPGDWSKAVAQTMADVDGVELEDTTGP